MSDSACEVLLMFGTERRLFRLSVPLWEKVEKACDAGPGVIARRLASATGAAGSDVRRIAYGSLGEFRVQDVRAPILQGLIGGGMKAEDAAALVEEWVDSRPLIDSVPTALAVVLVSIMGPEDEPLKPPVGDAAAGEGTGGA